MLLINYIQAYQTIELFPGEEKEKKSQFFIPVLIFLLIQNVKKSISHSEFKCRHAQRAQLWCFTPPTPQWPLFLSVFVVWAVGFVCLPFSPLLSFIFQQEKRGKKQGGEKKSV